MNRESKVQFPARAANNMFMLAEQLLGAERAQRWFGVSKARFQKRLQQRLGQTSPPEPVAVDRVDSLTPDEFHSRYFRKSLPVIVSQAAREWPACRKWSLDYFASGYGRTDLLLVEAEGLTTRDQRTDHEFLRLQELVNNIRKGGDSYLRFSPLMHEHPELARDLDMDWLAAMRGGKTFGNTYYMFMGGAGKKTYLHADQPCNLYVQVTGEKKWTMFLPEDSVCLYPQVTNTAYVRSPIDIDHPDSSRFPLYPHARAMTAHLLPGDVLYVPPHVWHQVENLSESIAVGYRFSSLAAALRSSVTFSLLRILCTNPPVWKTREYGKQDTNLIWAHTAGKIQEVLRQRELRREHEKTLS